MICMQLIQEIKKKYEIEKSLINAALINVNIKVNIENNTVINT
jgi:hypothetical protein